MQSKTYNFDLSSTCRADVYLSEQLGLTRSHVKKLCDQGYLTVNGKASKSNKTLKFGDEVTITLPENKNLDVEPENIPINIVYQDQDLAIIDKPQGMTVHAGNGTNGSTLVNALLYHLDNLSGINGVIRPGIVHRIDKNTSGLLVVAKNDVAHVSLAKQIESKTCRRVYVALLVHASLMQARTVLQRAVIACQRQHRDKVKFIIMLGNVLQHLHHGGRCNQVMPRKP